MSEQIKVINGGADGLTAEQLRIAAFERREQNGEALGRRRWEEAGKKTDTYPANGFIPALDAVLLEYRLRAIDAEAKCSADSPVIPMLGDGCMYCPCSQMLDAGAYKRYRFCPGCSRKFDWKNMKTTLHTGVPE